LIDPQTDERDVRGDERRIVFRHLRLGTSRDPIDHQAATAIARPHDRTVPAAVEHIFVGCQREAALALVLAVALETRVRDDRPNLCRVVDQRGVLRGG
jgi:hypothetical protein